MVLHEWDTDEADRPKLVTDETGREEYDGTEKPDNLVTWVYDGTSFTPVAKVTDGERYTIVHDYLGTPTQAYDSKGELVWEMLLDVYGEVKECHGDRTLVPFRYQGQYEDEETGLYYNRFRYYSPEMGMYISSDPIGLAGNNPTLYGYVQDVNTLIDWFGLDVYILRASQDGWYPVYKYGEQNPISYVLLQKDDIYKIGESQSSTRRYSQPRLNEARINRSTSVSCAVNPQGIVLQNVPAGLRMDIVSHGRSKKEDQALEKELIQDYQRQHNGILPPGNKACH